MEGIERHVDRGAGTKRQRRLHFLGQNSSDWRSCECLDQKVLSAQIKLPLTRGEIVDARARSDKRGNLAAGARHLRQRRSNGTVEIAGFCPAFQIFI